MRRAVTFSVSGSLWKQILGPEVPVKEHIANFKKLAASGNLDGADSIEVWTSDGRIKRAKSKTIAPQSADPEKVESENLEEVESNDSAESEQPLSGMAASIPSEKSKSKKR